MVFGISFGNATCPVCKMKITKDMKAIEAEGKKFCSEECVKEFQGKSGDHHDHSNCCH